MAFQKGIRTNAIVGSFFATLIILSGNFFPIINFYVRIISWYVCFCTKWSFDDDRSEREKKQKAQIYFSMNYTERGLFFLGERGRLYFI